MSTISTHVLDTARGVPAEGLPIALERLNGETFETMTSGVTDFDGRVRDFLPAGTQLENGTYRMCFSTGVYFEHIGVKGFYPYANVVFVIDDPASHYHVPLLLSPFGYSTYRGS